MSRDLSNSKMGFHGGWLDNRVLNSWEWKRQRVRFPTQPPFSMQTSVLSILHILISILPSHLHFELEWSNDKRIILPSSDFVVCVTS